jgi:hypothetical protein
MRFSLKALLLAFVIVGAGCAGILYPGTIWSSAFFTTALFVVLCAGISAFATRNRTRMYWIGFTVFGGGYSLSSMFADVQAHSPAQGTRAMWSEPRLVTSNFLLWCNERLNYLDQNELTN